MKIKSTLYRAINTLILILVLVILYFDFLFSNYFRMEEIFVICITLTVGIKIMDIISTPLKINHKLIILCDLTLIGILPFAFWVLAIAGFGSGYTSGELPLIWVLSFSTCILLVLQCIGDIVKRAKANF